MTINNSIDFFGIGRKTKVVKSQFGINNSKGIKSNYNFMGGKPINKIDSRFIGNPLSLAPKQQKFSKIHQSYWGEKHSNVPLWMQRNTDNVKNIGGSKPKIVNEKASIYINNKKIKSKASIEKQSRKKEMAEERLLRKESRIEERLLKEEQMRKKKKMIEEKRKDNQERRRLKRIGVKGMLEESGIQSVELEDAQALINTSDNIPKSRQQIREEKKQERMNFLNKKRKKIEEKRKISGERQRLNKMGIKQILYETGIENVNPEDAQALIDTADQRGLTKQEKAKEKTKELIKLYGKSKGFKDVLKSDKVFDAEVARKISEKKGMPLKTKYIKVLAEAEKRSILKHPITGTYQRGKETLKAAPKAFRESYGKEERAATRKVQKLVKAGLGGIFGASIMQQKFGPAIKGRPGGPSGRYMIEGKPVYEEEFQKYAAEQRAKNRIMPSQNQQAPLTAEQQVQMYSDQTVDTNQNLPSTSQPMTPGEIQASKQMVVPQRGYTSEEVKMAQELAQQQDNILNAPSFMKGELKATGGSLLTSTGPQIMDAPNAFKGQLRTLNRGEQVASVKIGDRPQTNPQGLEYIDIELGSGKPVLKKRIEEAWMDGRAL